MNHFKLYISLPFFVCAFFSINVDATANELNDYQVTASSSLMLEDPHADNTQAVVYIWPKPQQQSAVATTEQMLHSNEYWQEVTGAELNAGVAIYTTSNKAFIRIAPKAQFSDGEVLQSEPLNAHFLRLKPDMPNVQYQAIEQAVSQQEMSLAGFDDGSIALTTNLQLGAGRLIMQSQQSLLANATYLMHVKEKHSPHQLQITADNTFQAQSQGLKLEGSIAGKHLDPLQTTVNLISPRGEKTAAQFQQGLVVLPDNLANVGAYRGFYELEMTTEQVVEGLMIKRSIKVPFANVIKTAQLGRPSSLLVKSADISLPITIFHPGRYAVTATLAQYSASGHVEFLQTIEVAQWLKDDGLFALPFSINGNHHAPERLFLTDVKLVDQSRMMLLEQHTRWE